MKTTADKLLQRLPKPYYSYPLTLIKNHVTDDIMLGSCQTRASKLRMFPGNEREIGNYMHVAFNDFFMSETAFEPPHNKTSKMSVRPAKTQISLGIRPVWPESSLSAWRNIGSLSTHWAHSEDSDQTGRMPRLIWVFAGCTPILLVSSCRGSILRFTVM